MPAPDIRIRRGRADSVIVPMFVKPVMMPMGRRISWSRCDGDSSNGF